ncbi:MAG: aspartate aminotransferase family protein [Clostridia bacterium]|nr:aspartate aminotransferase family protein [Clostridia bacterium]
MFTDKRDLTVREKDESYIAGTYKRFPVVLSHGKGSKIWDENGKEYIDMGSGIGVTSFGIADDEWQNAVSKQAAKLQHTSNLYYTQPCAVLAEKLCMKTGMSKVFFSNSGAEANECAIKAARKYAAEKHGEDCYTVVTLKNSFHGRTLTTLAATGQEHYHEMYKPLTPGFESVDVHNIFELEALGSHTKIAAVMIECIQGEGGVNELKKSFVNEVAEYAQRRDILVICDEVQTGNGRTGQLYSYMNYGITPDIVTTAKGLAGGLPLGATLLGEKLKDIFTYGDHGSTFGGNPVCCAAAITVLDRIDEKLLSEVTAKGKYIVDAFSKTDGVEEISGMGLMIGLKTKKPAAEVVNKCLEKGVLCLTAKDKVRLLPALNIPMKDLEKAVEIIKTACNEE